MHPHLLRLVTVTKLWTIVWGARFHVFHFKQSQGAAGRGRSRHLVAGVCGADPGRLHQDDHLDDGEAERTDGPEDANRPGAPNKLCLIETREVGEGGRHRHD